jgi:hypothetical protein
MPDGYALYTDWSMLGHKDRTGADTALPELVLYNDLGVDMCP